LGFKLSGQSQGRNPADNRLMERIKNIDHNGLSYKIKQELCVFRESGPVYTVDRYGIKGAEREPDYFVWLPGEHKHEKITVERLTAERFSSLVGKALVPTRAVDIFKTVINGASPEETATKFNLSVARVKEIIEKGQKEGLLALYEEAD